MSLNRNPISIISFGSNDSYVKLSEKLLKKLKKRYKQADTIIFNKESLPEYISNLCIKNSRGFGYWIWKPFIILEALLNLNDGDLLFYIDGRTDFKSKKIVWLDEFEKKSPIPDLLAWQMDYKEFEYTNEKLFNLFEFNNNKDVINSGQYAATFMLIKKSDLTVKFIGEWLNTMNNNYDYCLDIYGGLDGFEFIENRYDQSVFSLLIKKYKTKGLNLFTIFNKEVYQRDSLMPHAKEHPRGIFYVLKSKIKRAWVINLTRVKIIKDFIIKRIIR